MSRTPIERALISVFNKDGIADFAKKLVERGVEILSTGGTYKLLSGEGIACTPVEEFTGQGEFFGGRVKTLHPLIHGGILSKRDAEANDLGIKPIDLVVVNLYPFEKLVMDGETDIDTLIEMIDIGGPTMLRSAAKNNRYVCSVCDPQFYDTVIQEMDAGGITDQTRLRMAVTVFQNTSYYDAVITNTLAEKEQPAGSTLPLPLTKSAEMRYGENPHQEAAYYTLPAAKESQVGDFFTEGKLHGKDLSFNNISDISAAMRILADLPVNSCVVLKHANPCGAAARATAHESFMAAYEGDKVSIFGGIVAFKGRLEAKTAEILKSIFLEIVIADSWSEEALEILQSKKNIRLMEYGTWRDTIFKAESVGEIKRVIGGVLVQQRDTGNPYKEKLDVVTKVAPSEGQLADMQFGQTLVKHVKSNAIVVVKDSMLVGVGAGQMNRVTAAKIALDWAGDKAKGAVMASDAFFPMDDTVRLANDRGIKGVIQPGGSIKDEDSIKACDDLGMSMVFTGTRHFYH
jgi:phosphoribosylaminoimidazolecarboxamide formyltransferase/IMP cyclohydrolase